MMVTKSSAFELDSAVVAVIVKSLELYRASRVRQQSKEIPGSPIYELLSDELASVDAIVGRFR
jgi:hypothetical protein